MHTLRRTFNCTMRKARRKRFTVNSIFAFINSIRKQANDKSINSLSQLNSFYDGKLSVGRLAQKHVYGQNLHSVVGCLAFLRLVAAINFNAVINISCASSYWYKMRFGRMIAANARRVLRFSHKSTIYEAFFCEKINYWNAWLPFNSFSNEIWWI